LDAGVKDIILHKEDVNSADFAIIYNTFRKIHLTLKKRLWSISIANCVMLNHLMKKQQGVFDKLFFSDKRYDLGEVGRYRINKKLGLNTLWTQKSLQRRHYSDHKISD
jgi:DNA-directed RNA polymerase subunit beta